MTRQVKSPAARAQEAVGVLERRLAKLRDKAKGLGDQVQATSREISDVERRLEYAKANPDLPSPTVSEADDPITTTPDTPTP